MLMMSTMAHVAVSVNFGGCVGLLLKGVGGLMEGRLSIDPSKNCIVDSITGGPCCGCPCNGSPSTCGLYWGPDF